MQINIYSNQKSHSFATEARFSVRNMKNIYTHPITSIDEISISSADAIDNVGLLCVGNNLNTIINEIKSLDINVPVIAMTEENDHRQNIHLLTLGYDDVIFKDCDLEEIVARFRSISRRAMEKPKNEIRNGRLVTFLDGRDPEVNGKRIKLTSIEYSILDTISRRIGTIISREKLFELVWTNEDKQPYDKVLDVHMFNLRKKLKKATGGETSFIETLPQRGYRILEDKPDNKKKASK